MEYVDVEQGIFVIIYNIKDYPAKSSIAQHTVDALQGDALDRVNNWCECQERLTTQHIENFLCHDCMHWLASKYHLAIDGRDVYVDTIRRYNTYYLEASDDMLAYFAWWALSDVTIADLTQALKSEEWIVSDNIMGTYELTVDGYYSEVYYDAGISLLAMQ